MPAAQVAHLPVPIFTELYVPDGHDVHTNDVDAVATLPNLPKAHAEHPKDVGAASMSPYRPEPQAVQTDAPVVRAL